MTDIMVLHEPEGWRLYRLGQLFDERKEKASDKDYPPLSVTMNGIVPQLESAAKSDDGDNRKLVKVGDYVINSRSDRKGSGGISSHSGSVSLISVVMEPKGVHPRFAHHLLRSGAFQEEFYRWGHGIVADLWTTRYADMKNIRLYLPDLFTQKAIANFLDRETARLDQLIEKKQRLVKLINEKRAVETDQLIFGPGDEGLMPSSKVKFLAKRISKGTTPSTLGAELVSEGVRFLRAENVWFGIVTNSPQHYISEETHRMMSRSALEANDILVVIAGSTGKAAVIREDQIPANINQAISFVRLWQPYLAPVISAAIQSKRVQQEILLTSVQSAQPNLAMEDLGNLTVPAPQRDDALALIERLESADTKYRSLTDSVSCSVGKLQEFRSALITAAVTGQINVENWGKQGQIDRRLDEIEETMQA